MSDDLVTAATRQVREGNEDVVAAVGAAAADAARGWPDGGVSDGARVRADFRPALRERGVPDRLPAVLGAAVEATGASLPAPAVAGPPYVVVTSTGVLLRATLDAGRLVLAIRAFERVDGRYRPRDAAEVAGSLR